MIVELTEKPKKKKTKKKNAGAETKTIEIKVAEPKAAAKTLKPAQAKNYIVIDHPAENENVNPRHYAVRIGVSGGDGVEISLDKGEWIPSRFSAGYFWHDLSGLTPGRHRLVARMLLPSGKRKNSKIVNFNV